MSKLPAARPPFDRTHPDYVQPMDFSDPVMRAIIGGICEVIRVQLEEPGLELLQTNAVATAGGSLLDSWGELVGEDRNLRSDEAYRVAIRARVRRNGNSGTWPEVISIARTIFGVPDLAFNYYDSPPLHAFLEILTDLTGVVEVEAKKAALGTLRAAGVRLMLQTWSEPEEGMFTFAAGTVPQTDEGRGFGDATDVETGGALASIEYL